MEVVEKQTDYRLEYEIRFYSQVQELVEKRKNMRISQSEIARLAGCSLRKVQMFENYKSLDAYLLFIYKKLDSDERR